MTLTSGATAGTTGGAISGSGHGTATSSGVFGIQTSRAGDNGVSGSLAFSSGKGSSGMITLRSAISGAGGSISVAVQAGTIASGGRNDQCWRIDGEDWWRRVDRFGLWHCDIKWCLQYPHGKRWHRWPKREFDIVDRGLDEGVVWMDGPADGRWGQGCFRERQRDGRRRSQNDGRACDGKCQLPKPPAGRFRLFLGLAVLHQAVRLVSKHRRAGLQEHLELWCFRPGYISSADTSSSSDTSSGMITLRTGSARLGQVEVSVSWSEAELTQREAE